MLDGQPLWTSRLQFCNRVLLSTSEQNGTTQKS